MEHILFTGIDTQNGKSMYKYKRAKFQFYANGAVDNSPV